MSVKQKQRRGDLRWAFLVGLVTFGLARFLIGPDTMDAADVPLASADLLAANFEAVVFGKEAGPSSDHIEKWTRSVVILADGDPNRYARNVLEQIAATLGRLTGLAVVVLYEPDGSENVIARFMPERQLRDAAVSTFDDPEKAGSVRCFARFHMDGMSRIERGELFIPSDKTDKILHHCIVEEATQTFGVSSDSNLITPAMFSDDFRVKDLTVNDMILVRTLYDPRLKPGMHKDEAMPIAREIIAELVARVEAGGDPHEVLSQGSTW